MITTMEQRLVVFSHSETVLRNTFRWWPLPLVGEIFSSVDGKDLR